MYIKYYYNKQRLYRKSINKLTFIDGDQLQSNIEGYRHKYSSQKIIELLSLAPENNIMEVNKYGNNTLHFAVYVGQLETVIIILYKFPNIDLQVKNQDIENTINCCN